jgi:hypothetical protein
LGINIEVNISTVASNTSFCPHPSARFSTPVDAQNLTQFNTKFSFKLFANLLQSCKHQNAFTLKWRELVIRVCFTP